MALIAVLIPSEVTGFELPADGAWHHFELDADLDFDPAGTDLVALQLLATVPTDEIKFKNLSMTRLYDANN